VKAATRGFLLGAGLLLCLAPLAGWAVPDTVRIPSLRPHPTETPTASGLFSHWSHASYRCFSCHPAIFPQSLVGFTHTDMGQGKFCGRCHGGGSAPAPSRYRCESCHVPR
jgi:c(7)-type cytochrome triheme protein